MKEQQSAPGNLEHVRSLLNSWRIPNDTRVATDLLTTREDARQFRLEHFPELEAGDDQVEQLRQLRDDLRGTLGSESIVETVNPWLERFPLKVVLESGEGVTAVRYQPLEREAGLCGIILALVVEAVAQDQWWRLKPCQDCQWVFFDHTKNASKVWCSMLANGPEGRSCGSIAKVRRWRERQKKQHES